MSDILDEVLNDEKDEKRLLLFRRLLPIIVVLTIVVASSISIYYWYDSKKEEHNKKIGDMFTDLVFDKYKSDSLTVESLEGLIKTSENKESELADIKIASIYINSGKISDAMIRLESIVENTKYTSLTTSFARLLWLNLILDVEDISEDLKNKAVNYSEYFSNKDQPFFANATLLKALFYKKINKLDMALKHAEILLEEESAPLVIKEQAKAILSSI